MSLGSKMMVSGKFVRSFVIRPNILIGYLRPSEIIYIQNKQASNKSATAEQSEPQIPHNVLKGVYSATNQKDNGKIYDKKPFKMRLEKDKTYMWCLCGHSKSQPICDGAHTNTYMKIKQRPIKFQVDETKEYWLCNCKQTANRPFCDGTHKRADIQDAIR